MDWAWLDIGISAERERARRDLYGNSIAFAVRSVDHSLFTHLIPYGELGVQVNGFPHMNRNNCSDLRFFMRLTTHHRRAILDRYFGCSNLLDR